VRSRPFAAACALALVASLGAAPPQPRFAIAAAPYAFAFPRDHFAHDAYRTEWWYFTGHLQAADGRRFGYELTFFRIGLEPYAATIRPGQSAWRTTQLYPAHFAITDERDRAFSYGETLARGALQQGAASESRLDVRANGWSLTGDASASPRMHLSASYGGDALDLVQIPQKPAAIHGTGGISKKGPCASCASHYYSFTRLLTRGTLTRGGTRYAVSGVSWMDHEFGSDELLPTQTGWDWFSIQLDDDREIMLYRLRQRDGSTTPQSSGSLVARNGSVTHLALDDFHIEARSTWTSPHTHAVYPSGWVVRVNGVKPPLLLVPLLDDQELVDAGGTSYWEGAVDVRDLAGGRRLGQGYVELTGYASPVTL
jgi:predicted secreted hydrolase